MTDSTGTVGERTYRGNMRIVHTASEMFPYVKTGGLADVVGALSAALARHGHEVTVCLPAYRPLLESPLLAGLERTRQFAVPLGARELTADIYECEVQPGLRLVLVGRDEYFDRQNLYWTGEREYDDNDERFIFFQRAVVAWVLSAGGCDILHAHDWQTGLLPVLARHAEQRAGRSHVGRTVFTVHNMIYQGVCPRSAFALTGLHDSLNSMEGLEYYGKISLLKGGLMYADRVTTVSPTYALEMQTPAHGYGLEGVARLRGATLRGIRNGIDTTVWNPTTDRLLPANFSAHNLTGKTVCRAELLAKLGWAGTHDPLFVIISRMTTAKGHDLLLGSLGGLLRRKCRLIVLGTGEKKYEEAHLANAAAHPERIAVRIGVDEGLSHLAFAGADFFLMPSHTEPCGLTQMYAQVYGAVPVACRVGGLADTVRDLDEDPAGGTGLLCAPNSEDWSQALDRALRLFAEPSRYAAVQHRAMQQDFSWETVVGQYEELYTH
jgi:starch synthase